MLCTLDQTDGWRKVGREGEEEGEGEGEEEGEAEAEAEAEAEGEGEAEGERCQEKEKEDVRSHNQLYRWSLNCQEWRLEVEEEVFIIIIIISWGAFEVIMNEFSRLQMADADSVRF